MMLEAARLLAGASVLLLIGALVTWLNLLGHTQLRTLDGSAVTSVGRPAIAALLLFAAVGLSAVAAILAIAGWFGA